MKKTGFFKNCDRCTKPFWVYQYNKTRKYCSPACSNKSNALAQSATKRAKSQFNFSADKKWRYNVLYIEWRNQCLSRDNFTCQNCGKKVTARTGIVHHPKSWKEYPELRYELSNGMTVCRGCHNIVDDKIRQGNPYSNK